jgi:hypothetical protein
MSKNIVCFINKTNNFANSMISFFEQNFPDAVIDYYIIDRRKEENLDDKPYIHRILSYSEFFFNSELIQKMKSCEKIIISGVFTMQYVMLFRYSKYLNKTYFHFWGGDFYQFINAQSLRTRIEKIVDNFCLKRCKAIVLLLSSEKKTFINFFPFTSSKAFYYAIVPNGKKDDDVQCQYRKLAMSRLSDGKKRIVVGNSATKTNEHIAVFNQLKKMNLDGVEIFCPLSYGDMSYQKQVIEEGRKIFGDDFCPITEYMNYDQYNELLLNCDVGIYNNNRQQGLGNISAMINMGKKVFIRKDTAMWESFQQYGYIMNDVSMIGQISKEEFFEWSESDIQKNFEAIERKKNDVKENWRKVLLG